MLTYAQNSCGMERQLISQEVLEAVVRLLPGNGGFTLSARADNFSEPKNPQRAITCSWYGVFLYSSLFPPSSFLVTTAAVLLSSQWDRHSGNVLSQLLIVLLVIRL